MDDATLRQLAERLCGVRGVRGVVLGGSRSRGDHTPESDHDLGLYYESELDVDALGALAREVAGPGAAVTGRGEWGPWVDGGGWLRIADADVDWIYRDLARVRRSWADARAGRFVLHTQVGHPFGVPSTAYAAEVALSRVLADPSGELTALREATQTYPPALADAVVAGLWEADFLVANARKAVSRADTTFVAGCLFRVACLCAHAVHARARRWVSHEKGIVAAAAALPGAPRSFADLAHGTLADLGRTPSALAAAVDAAAHLVEIVRAAPGSGA